MMLKYRNRAETPGNNIYSLLITSFISSISFKLYFTHTNSHITPVTQSGAKKSLFQFCLTITEPFSPYIVPGPHYSMWPKRFGSRGPCQNVSRPFTLDTSPKQIDQEGLGKRRTGTRASFLLSFYLEDVKNDFYKVLLFSCTVSQLIMRVHKPKVEYKLVLQGKKPHGKTLRY